MIDLCKRALFGVHAKDDAGGDLCYVAVADAGVGAGGFIVVVERDEEDSAIIVCWQELLCQIFVEASGEDDDDGNLTFHKEMQYVSLHR